MQIVQATNRDANRARRQPSTTPTEQAPKKKSQPTAATRNQHATSHLTTFNHFAEQKKNAMQSTANKSKAGDLSRSSQWTRSARARFRFRFHFV
jgi:hypothetical protein